MSRSLADVGWVTRNDGKRDERYRMPQVLNSDGSRDGRYNLFEQPKFSSSEMNQAGYRGMDVRARYAAADSRLEARAQELFLLGQRNFAWNSQNNDGAVPYWWRG
ncbi:unnamed protein product, partial [Rotaria sordida]